MLTILIVLALFIVFDLAALRWGVDSTDGIASCEWEHRWHWSNTVDNERVAYYSLL